MDLFVVPTIGFNLLYVMVIVFSLRLAMTDTLSGGETFLASLSQQARPSVGVGGQPELGLRSDEG